VVLHHHEHFNGSGYPHGLRGKEIPLGARIVAVADAYHAMVHDRPYKTARDHQDALRELRVNAGTQFDPEIVNLFCQLYALGVPPDGLAEVYSLHQRARDGLQQIDPGEAVTLLGAAGSGHGHVHANGNGQKRGGRKPAAEDATPPQPADRAAS
jgi:hypothetical protein